MGRAQGLRVLLDTHVWLWRLLEPERLSHRLRRVLADRGTEIHLSPISAWEVLVLARKGRLRLAPDPAAWVRRALEVSRPKMVPLTHEIALQSEDLPGFASADPADRFLAATALVEKLRLASVDPAMLSFEPARCLR